MRALRYAWDEATASLWRGRRSGALSTSTIAVALFVLGAVLMATSNLDRLATEWSGAAEMAVYLTDEASDSDRAAIEAVLTPAATAAGVQFVSKADALARFKQTFVDLAPAADALEANPLPASYEVQLNADAMPSSKADELAARLRPMSGVADVRYDREWLDRLRSGVGVVRGIGLMLAIALTIAAALTVANVVRLALHARRDEIEIMELVGAPPTFIRGPFLMEGVLQGAVGAVAALVLLAVVFLSIRGRLLVPLAAALNLSSIRFLPVELCLLLLLGGMAVGCAGAFVAATGGSRAGHVT